MKMQKPSFSKMKFILASGVAALTLPSAAHAQYLASEWEPMDSSESAAPAAEEPVKSSRGGGHDRGQDHPKVEITPYIEVSQVALAELTGAGDVLTYSTVAAGLDTSIQTRRAEAQLNVRYERVIGYDSSVPDQDTVTGIARGSALLARGLSLEVGGVATRAHIDSRGSASNTFFPNSDNVTQVYSVYTGPSYSGQVGELGINASYRAGYTKVEAADTGPLPLGQRPIATFDESTSHSAAVSVGMQPGTLPVGWSVGAGYDREDASQLDQRFEGKYVRGDVTVPISSGLAVVGGIGYEKIKISERDSVRDALGAPVLDVDGRFVTNSAAPRQLAFETDGIIWDVGVMWKPSDRTSFTATYGHRYGSDTYTGSLSYVPNERMGINVSVYDTVSGFGNALNDSLASLPTQFRSSRNPLSGDINSCAFSQSGGNCLNNALRTTSSAAFRSQGVSASIATKSGSWDSGIAVGYDRRKFLTAGLGAQPELAGVVDQNYYLAGFVGKELDQRSRVETNVYANYNDPGFALAPDAYGFGANAAYYRQLWRGLSLSAAAGIDTFKQEQFDSEVTASALLGLRYSF
jgi:hypothetical protein